jgi:AcrR family transcriptional regulator
MSAQPELQRPPAAEDKRRQIMEGARKTFLAQGFDAASMGEIARAAGVSKGTLYVYFENKEQLFQAIVGEQCQAQAKSVFDLDPNDRNVEAVLTRLGIAFVNFLCRPESASPWRTVIAIADRMPEIGKAFYESGPLRGTADLAAYFEAQNKAGVLAVEDCEIAAAQFLESCQATLFKPVILNFGSPPTAKRIAHVVRIAVRTFLAAYRAR